jgi:hypothetical protein
MTNPDLAHISDGKKFMWDGRSFEKREEALRLAETYRKDGFEVRMVEEGGRSFLYTRRVVKEAAAAGQ